MLSRRTRFLVLLLWGWALLIVSAGSLSAQDNPKTEKPAETEEAEDPTPWPPPNTEKHEIKRTETQKQGLVMHVPKDWKKTDPDSNLRLAQFTIPPAKGEKDPVELAIFSFQGQGAGGGVSANVERWVNQFPGEKTEKKIVTGKGHQGLYVLVDLKGTYQPPPFVQGGKPMPEARMLAAIIGIRWEEEEGEGDDKETVQKSAVYFLKMVGPKKSVSAVEEDFRLAFGATNRSKENPIPVKDE